MTKTLSPLEKLKAQQAVITARIQVMEARHKHAERKKETRRKILIGSYYLEQAIKNNNMEAIKNVMADYLTRNSDRKLFNLPDIKDTTQNSAV